MNKEKNELENVLIFEKKNIKPKTLSDDDIKRLFLGLVKLVKNNAQSEANSLNANLIKQNQINLSKSNMIITIQEEEIECLEKKNDFLNKKLLDLKQKIAQLRCELIDAKNKNKNSIDL